MPAQCQCRHVVIADEIGRARTWLLVVGAGAGPLVVRPVTARKRSATVTSGHLVEL
jgi:hypothetical protein